jgi:hypothetical protein
MTMDRTVLGRLLGASSRRSRSAGAAIMTETRLSKGDGHLRCSPEAIAVPVLVEVDATKESLKSATLAQGNSVECAGTGETTAIQLSVHLDCLGGKSSGEITCPSTSRAVASPQTQSRA